jgi:hypothetical protein
VPPPTKSLLSARGALHRRGLRQVTGPSHRVTIPSSTPTLPGPVSWHWVLVIDAKGLNYGEKRLVEKTENIHLGETQRKNSI